MGNMTNCVTREIGAELEDNTMSDENYKALIKKLESLKTKILKSDDNTLQYDLRMTKNKRDDNFRNPFRSKFNNNNDDYDQFRKYKEDPNEILNNLKKDLFGDKDSSDDQEEKLRIEREEKEKLEKERLQREQLRLEREREEKELRLELERERLERERARELRIQEERERQEREQQEREKEQREKELRELRQKKFEEEEEKRRQQEEEEEELRKARQKAY